MKIIFSAFFFCFFVLSVSYGQTDTLHINGFTFVTVKKTQWNEYERKDTVLKFYRIENGQAKYLLKHYIYKCSADCNNEFEDFGSYEIHHDSLIFITEYSQQTGMDPIPYQRKQVYIIRADGKLIEVYDKQLMQGSDKWEDTTYNDD